jgi:hypothetical protein
MVKLKTMILTTIAAFLNMCLFIYLNRQVSRNRKLIRELAILTQKMAEKL